MSGKPVKKAKTLQEALSKGADPKNNVFIVDKVLDKRIGKAGREEYLIQWQGFSKAESSWEPRENIQCSQMITDFEKEFTAKKEKRPRGRRPQAGASSSSAIAADPSDGTSSSSGGPAAPEDPADEQMEEEAEEDHQEEEDPNDVYNLNNKQLECFVGLTKAPGELHFLCKFSDDTCMLVPAKECNSRYRPFVDEYGKFLKTRMEIRQRKLAEGGKKKTNKSEKAEEKEEGPEWPEMPAALLADRNEKKEGGDVRKKHESESHDDVFDGVQPTPSEILHDMQMAASGSLSSDFLNEHESFGEPSEPLLDVFNDPQESPMACPIVVDTITNGEDEELSLFPKI